MRRILCLFLAGVVLCLGSLVLTVPERITSQANAQASSNSPDVSHCRVNAVAYRGSGQTITCSCSSSEAASGGVWGNGTYTDDSKICRAAVHAGVIGSGGGRVTFTVRGGQSSYRASSRNGVSSSNYGSWAGSYRLRGGSSSGGGASSGARAPASTPTLSTPQAGKPNNIGNCPTNATGYRGSGGSYTCSCSTAASASGSVWGTYVYTDDSAICRAAVQAGVISAGGGQVIFNILPGQSSYRGTGGGTHNGVSSSDYGSWQGSYKFAPWAPPVRSSSGGGASSGTRAPVGTGTRVDDINVGTGTMVNDNHAVAAGFGTRSPANTASACPSNATAYRGSGRRITCSCDSGATGSGSVWGTGTYTDDSKICRAAVHEGVIGSGGGQVTFMMIGGQSSYQSSSRFGVLSSSFGSWQGSYRFRSGSSSGGGASSGARATVWEPVSRGRGEVMDRSGDVLARIPTRQAGRASSGGACPPNMAAMRGQNGRSLTCSCSAADAASGNESVWGGANNVYTDDSKICRAALQAGAIGPSGGTVTVMVGPEQSSYTGTTRNGVSTGDAGKWPGSSYKFVP